MSVCVCVCKSKGPCYVRSLCRDKVSGKVLVDVVSPRYADVCEPFNVTCDVTLTREEITNINYISVVRHDVEGYQMRVMFNSELTPHFINDKYKRYRAVNVVSKNESVLDTKITLMVTGMCSRIQLILLVNIPICTAKRQNYTPC